MDQQISSEYRVPADGTGIGFANLPARILSGLACVFLFAMMTITFLDVIGRYAFNSPLPAAYEIVSLIMPAIIFCALPLTVLKNGHVTVDLLDGFVPGWLSRIQAVVVNLFGATALAMLSWRLAIRSRDQRTYEEVTDELVLELWPFSAVMSVLCAVAAVAFIVNIAAQFARIEIASGAQSID
jgi:TRAP-type C4-dicarboxylate transport system permease small subunit